MDVVRLLLLQLIPLIFVLLWSTGFIAAKYALPYIEPFNFLLLRMIFNVLIFILLIRILKRSALTLSQALQQMVAGLLVHAGYLGGVFAAISGNMPAGVSALIVGLQPLLTTLLAWYFFKQSLQRRQYYGLVLGGIGVILVLYGNDRLHLDGEVRAWAFGAIVIALISISLGTIYQKRFGSGVDLVSASFYQYLSTAIVIAILSYSFETRVVDWQWPLIAALAWSVLGLSVVAVLLLLYMIREQESSRVASYFYLVPPLAAWQAWLLFEESFSWLAIFGVILTVWGVYWVTQAGIKPTLATKND